MFSRRPAEHCKRRVRVKAGTVKTQHKPILMGDSQDHGAGGNGTLLQASFPQLSRSGGITSSTDPSPINAQLAKSSGHQKISGQGATGETQTSNIPLIRSTLLSAASDATVSSSVTSSLIYGGAPISSQGPGGSHSGYPSSRNKSILDSSSSSTHPLPARANKVLLPINEHGIRTRVNILPSSSFSQRDSLYTTTSSSRPISSYSAITMSENGKDMTNSAYHTDSRENEVTQRHSISRLLNTQILPLRLEPDMPVSARRSISDSHLANLKQRADVHALEPGSSRSASDSSARPYKFPATPRNADFTKESGVSNSASSSHYTPTQSLLPAESDQRKTSETHSETYKGPSYSQSSFSSFSLGDSPRLGLNASSFYTTPSSTKPSPQSYTSFDPNSTFGTSSRMAIRKSVTPGGYDSSPTSSSEAERKITARELSKPSTTIYERADNLNHPHADMSDPSSAGFLRDRSASVPRTVSDLDENWSGRVSEAEEGVSVYPSLKSPNLSESEFSNAGAMQSSNVSHSQRLHPSGLTREHKEPLLRYPQGVHTSPLISPVAPRLDIEFGDQSSFSLNLDFAMPHPDETTNTTKDGPRLVSLGAPASGNAMQTTQQFGQSFVPVKAIKEGSSKSPSKHGSKPEGLRLGLGWGFPPTARLMQMEDTSQDAELYENSSFGHTNRTTLSDASVTPKASLLPSTVLREASQPSFERTPGHGIVPSLQNSRDEIYKAAYPNHTVFRSYSGGLSNNPQRSHERSFTSESVGSSQFSRVSSSSVLHQTRQTSEHDDTESDSKRTTVPSKEHHTVQNLDSALIQHSNASSSTRASINKSLPPVPLQDNLDMQAVARDIQTRNLRLGAISLSSPHSFGSNDIRSIPPSNYQRPVSSVARSVPQRSRSDSTASSLSAAASGSVQLQNHQYAYAGRSTRSRSSTLQRQLRSNFGREGEVDKARASLALDVADPDLGPLGSEPARIRSQIKQSHSSLTGEVAKRDSAIDKLLVSAKPSLALRYVSP